MTFTAACLQVNAPREPEAAIAAACDLARRARDAGADFILMPENVAMMEPVHARLRDKAQGESGHAALGAFRDLARETGAWLLAGSLHILLAGGKVANRSFLIDPQGGIAARYDKLHMFDVDLDGGESYRESAVFHAGAKAVLADLPWGRLGLSICYDLRFAYLYRALAQAGADFLAVPAAFTRQTGQAHWHVLLRARAIETGCYVLAPAQCGTHAEGRQTFGHSLIVDPWGRVLADGGEEPGFVMAEIDPAEVAAARQKIPALRHDRAIEF
ncbi:MAG: carbon-nitrogen hydrolase family protein [Magnetospirillum sp. WYHS-4]